MENIEKIDKTPAIKIERWEFDIMKSMKIDNPKLLDWMERNRIRFNMGDILIEIDGVRMKMVTSREDFGTIIQKDNE